MASYRRERGRVVDRGVDDAVAGVALVHPLQRRLGEGPAVAVALLARGDRETLQVTVVRTGPGDGEGDQLAPQWAGPPEPTEGVVRRRGAPDLLDLGGVVAPTFPERGAVDRGGSRLMTTPERGGRDVAHLATPWWRPGPHVDAEQGERVGGGETGVAEPPGRRWKEGGGAHATRLGGRGARGRPSRRAHRGSGARHRRRGGRAAAPRRTRPAAPGPIAWSARTAAPPVTSHGCSRWPYGTPGSAPRRDPAAPPCS